MKRTYLTVGVVVFAAACLLPGSATAFGLDAAVGGWRQSPTGDISYKAFDPTRDTLDLESDLHYEDETRVTGRLNIDMPLFIPNLYVMATPMEFEGNGDETFKFGNAIVNGPFQSKTTLDHLDVALYYGIPLLETASLDTLNIDLGINVRIYDLKLQMLAAGVNEQEDWTVPVPMVFLALQFRPREWLAFEAEGRGTSYKGNLNYSLIARVRWNMLGPMFITGGYRYDKIDVDYEDVVVNADFSGPFAEIGFGF
jgi:outer membrane protein